MNFTYRAIGFICICKLVFAVQDVIIKEMSGGFPVHEIMVIRSIVSMILLAIAIRLSKGKIAVPFKTAKALLFRGALLFGSFTFFYLGLSAMPLTVTTVLFFTAPFFITILSIPILGERVGLRRWVGIAIGFIGVLVILRPDTEAFGIESLLPVMSAILYSISQLMARKLGINASAASMTFYANITYLCLGIVLALVTLPFEAATSSSQSLQFLLRPWQIPMGLDAILILLTGITGALGFWLSTQAYRISEVNQIAPFEYAMLVWVPILSYIVWNELPDGMTVFGAAIIVSAGLYVLKRDKIKADNPIVSKSLSRTR